MSGYWIDILAVGFFILEWTVYAVTLEHSAYGRDSLSARMHGYREIWIRRMLDRETRIVDMQIMASLQNGTAFFASTSLLASAAGWRCCARPARRLVSFVRCRSISAPQPALWELKCVGLILIFIYAFCQMSPGRLTRPVQLRRDRCSAGDAAGRRGD